MKPFWKKRNQEPSAVALWLCGGDGQDVIRPTGYTPLSQNEDIRRCVGKIAGLVSCMTVMLMENREGGDVRIRNELSRKLDITPNRNMTRMNFIQRIVTDMCIYGNAVAYPTMKGGYLESLDPWDASAVSFHAKGSGYEIHYQGRTFQPDEVLHFVWNPDGREPFRGVGVAPQLRGTVENLLQENSTKSAFLRSKWKPSMIISIQADNADLQDKELRRNILGSYVSETEQGEPWVIPAGEIDVKTIQPLTLRDLSLQDGITLDKQEIAAAIGVPGFLVGVGQFSREEHNHFVATTIMEFATGIQQELTRKLVTSPKWYVKLNQKSLLQYSLTEKMGFVKEMVAGGMLSRNEGRNEFDYAPVDNEGMNDYIVLENYVPVERVGDQKKLTQKGGETADE